MKIVLIFVAIFFSVLFIFADISVILSCFVGSSIVFVSSLDLFVKQNKSNWRQAINYEYILIDLKVR